MYQKTCTCCKRTSYSSCKTDKWLCPYCTYDMTQISAVPAIHNSKVSTIYKKLNEQKAREAYQKAAGSIHSK